MGFHIQLPICVCGPCLHSQLSEVLWNMVLKNAFTKGFLGVILLYGIFAAWAFLTLAILVLMEDCQHFYTLYVFTGSSFSLSFMKVKVPYSIHSHLTRSSRKMQSWRVLLPSLHLSWGKIRRNIRTIHIFSIRILIERCFIFSITYKTDKTINICILPNSDKIWLFKINLW